MIIKLTENHIENIDIQIILESNINQILLV